MAIIIDTPTIHKSLASLVLQVTPNAYIYDNPNQQGTHLPAWFIVHREPVNIKEDLHGRYWLNYGIDLYYMLDFNLPHLFDDYAAIADQLGEISEYLPIYGYENVVTHTYERSWGMYMDALKFSFTLKFRVTRDATPPAYMQVIEDLSVFLKGLKPEFYTLSFTNTEHPDFTVELPDDIVVSANAFVKLPSVSGKHTEDEETWVTSRWDIGEFGSSVKMDEDKVANLLWEELQQFVVSFANTTYPQFDVDLPEQAVVIAGESITLPSVSGQFVEDGYVYTPSGWDIGDFGSEFTPTGNTIANLIFNAEKQYEEITLYLPSGNKQAQSGVTSSYTGNVNSSYCYPLYTDEECTTLWNGYDYSNDYELGRYVDGVWTPYTRQNVANMPASTTGNYDYVFGRILLDTGELWHVTNYQITGTTANLNPIIRIYPKTQQHFAAYAYGAKKYENAYIDISTSKICTSRPGSTQYIQTPHQWPHITLQKVLGAAGNEITATTFVTGQGADNTRFYVYNSGTHGANIRTVVFTLEYPILGHWLKSDGTNISTSSGVAYPLMNIGGEIIEIDNDFDYFPVALIQQNGNYATSTYSYLNDATMGAFDPDHPTRLCFRQVSGTLSLSYVQYYKKPKPIEVNFGDPVTIPAGYTVESVKTSRLFVKADSVSQSMLDVSFTFGGENLYCCFDNPAIFNSGVSPCLSLYAPTNDATDTSVTGVHVTGKSLTNFTISGVTLNSGGVFLSATATASNLSYATTVYGAMLVRCVMIRYYDSGGNQVMNCFDLQSDLWQFQNGVFSWLGDDSSSAYPAYYYKGEYNKAMRIYLRKI